jgi:hypothetical protein
MMFPIVTTMVLLAQPISLQFEGPLKDALKEIALKGHINVVVAGDLDESVQVNLTDVSAEEALETVAKVYSLEITRQGKLWILRELPHHAAPPVPALGAVPLPPPMPVVPIVPVVPAEPPVEADAAEAAHDELSPADMAEKIREKAEAAKEKAEELRDRAKELAAAKREQAAALKKVAQANADLERDKVSAGGPVHVEANSTVDSAIAYGGPVIVEENAVVEGDAVAFGGNVELKANAVVDGDAVAFGGKVIKGPNAVVRGETVSMGSSSLGNAVGNIAVNSERMKERHKDSSEASSFGKRVAVSLLQFALFFGLGFVVMVFAPQRMRAIEATIKAEPTKNGLAGLLGLLAAIPASLLLIVTLVGIPVFLLMWVILGLFVPVGLAAVANIIGGALPTGPLRRTQALVLALGILALILVANVPVLGPIAMAAAVFVSLGAIIRTRFGQPAKGTPVLDSMPSSAAV